MPSEPDWSKQISNATVCTWFYALALVNAFFAVAGIVLVLMLMSKKIPMSSFVIMILTSALGFTNMWFLFLVCNRGLKA